VKALVHFAMVFEVDEEEEIAAVALAMRQRMYFDTISMLEEKGYSQEQIDSMQMYPPTYSIPIDFCV
jgi:hypothetical protein